MPRLVRGLSFLVVVVAIVAGVDRKILHGAYMCF